MSSSKREAPRASWVDRLNDEIDRLAVPAWVPYGVLFLLPPALLAAPGWLAGRNVPVQDIAFYFLAGFWTVFPLALIHHLDRFARHALEQFRPACDLDEAETAAMQHSLTTMPARPAAVAGWAGAGFVAAFYFVAPNLYGVISTTPLQFALGFVLLSLNFAFLGTLIYHTVRQLRLVSAVYDRARRLDLFNLTPLYAFSALAARTAIAWAFALYLSAVLFPQLLGNWIAVVVLLLQVVLLMAVFTLPLIGIHRRISSAKDQALNEVSASLHRAIRELNRRTEPLALEDMDALNKLVTGLIASREVVAKVPTWPWSSGTPLAVASALLLPVGLYLVQRLAERLIGL